MQATSSVKKVIVIGAGIAGCSTAYALAKRGIQVILVEQHAQIASEASGNPVAMLYPKYTAKNDPLSQFTQMGFAYTLDLLNQISTSDLTYQLCGQIQLAFNPREEEKLSKLPYDKAYQIVSKTEASEIAGIPLSSGGLFLPSAGWINPRLVCQALIESPNINKVMSNKALSIRQSYNHYHVIMNNQTLHEADMVVACNANALQQFDQCMDMPITAVRGQVNFFDSHADSEKINTILCTDHYLSPVINGRHSVGTTYGPNDLNATLSAVDTHTNLASIKTISPQIYEKIDQSTISGRVAWRSATKDYLPLAGQMIQHKTLKTAPPRYNDSPQSLPWISGFYVNAGHGSKGMITAPLCGEMIAAMISNEPLPVSSDIAAKINPSRFALKSLGLKKLAQNLYKF